MKNRKKPIFGIVFVVAVALCIAVVVCFLIKPSTKHEERQSEWDCSVLCAGTSSDEEFIITYSHEKPISTTGIFSFQNRNGFDIEIHLAREMYDAASAPSEDVFVIPAGGVTARYQIEKNVSYQIGIHADIPVDTEIQLMVYDGKETEVYSSFGSIKVD